MASARGCRVLRDFPHLRKRSPSLEYTWASAYVPELHQDSVLGWLELLKLQEGCNIEPRLRQRRQVQQRTEHPRRYQAKCALGALRHALPLGEPAGRGPPGRRACFT